MEAEHRKILQAALFPYKKKNFAEVLAAIPEVGCDSDFERLEDSNNHDVFD